MKKENIGGQQVQCMLLFLPDWLYFSFPWYIFCPLPLPGSEVLPATGIDTQPSLTKADDSLSLSD